MFGGVHAKLDRAELLLDEFSRDVLAYADERPTEMRSAFNQLDDSYSCFVAVADYPNSNGAFASARSSTT